MTDELVKAADRVITRGCGDARPIYPGKRYEDWELDDPAGADLDGVRHVEESRSPLDLEPFGEAEPFKDTHGYVASAESDPSRGKVRATRPLSARVRARPCRSRAHLLRTTSERADRPRAEDCFALAKQSSGEVSAVHLVLVHCGVSRLASARSLSVRVPFQVGDCRPVGSRVVVMFELSFGLANSPPGSDEPGRGSAPQLFVAFEPQLPGSASPSPEWCRRGCRATSGRRHGVAGLLQRRRHDVSAARRET